MTEAMKEIYKHLIQFVTVDEALQLLENYKQEILTAEDMKVISHVEYNDLVERSETLRALEQGGVDNWSFYGQALKDYFGDDDNDDY